MDVWEKALRDTLREVQDARPPHIPADEPLRSMAQGAQAIVVRLELFVLRAIAEASSHGG